MKYCAALAFLLFALSSPARAICVRTTDYSREDALAAASVVFVATITEASLAPVESQRGSKDIRWYTVRYKFRVALPIKGDPKAVPFLTTSGVYSDPLQSRFSVFGEQSRFVPGDSILVITDESGPVPISWIDCGDSMPWSREAEDLLMATHLWPNP